MSTANQTNCCIIFVNNIMVIVMDYKKRLYDLRTDNDLRQEDVANILKISSQAYGMYENGKRGLPVEHLITLSKYYNVTSDYILGLSDTKMY